MMLDALPRESAALNALEPRWRKLGYTSFASPRGTIAAFLKGFRPDAIAIGADPQLVIEVLSKRSGPAETRVKQLQSLFAGHTDWRLEVVYLGADAPEIEVAPAADIRKALERLRPLVDREPGAAFLMAWATLEAGGRLLEPTWLREASRLVRCWTFWSRKVICSNPKAPSLEGLATSAMRSPMAKSTRRRRRLK